MLQFLLFWVFPAIDVKSVIITDGCPGNGSTSSVVNTALLVESKVMPSHSLNPNALYLSKLHVNGGFTGLIGAIQVINEILF